ncbi:MAG: flagellar export protein FliJ [Sulfuricellaceae bacterium]|nr:flagellar export protein FliJ [Sulfuricellaceae bacterium]
MARKFPLQTLLDLAQNKADGAAKSLQELKVRWDQAESQLKQLLEYRELYRDRLKASASGGTSALALRDFNLFMLKLDAAIKLQQEDVSRCRQRWEAGQQEWMHRKVKVKALDTLSYRHQQAENKREERIEQKEQDEFSSRQGVVKGPSGDEGQDE